MTVGQLESRRPGVVPDGLLPGSRFDTIDGHRASMVPVAATANPHDDPADLEALAAHARALLAAVDRSVALWVEQSVRERWEAWSEMPMPEALGAAAREAGARASAEVAPALAALLATDVDEQRNNPLAILRAASRFPTAVLSDAGVPVVARDADAVRIHPDDLYDLGPAAFADLGASVHEAGLVWGAAKAHVVLARRRGEGR